MTEEHDSRISDLYRQSSQETPSAALDRAVMDRARKSVRKRVFSPFGNHWVTGGAMLGVVMLSVLLIVNVPQQPDYYSPEQDMQVPSSEARPEIPAGTRKEAAKRRAPPPALAAEAEMQREVPASPKPHFDFYNVLPDMEITLPEDEPRRLQPPITADARLASPAAEVWYLQAGSFRDKQRADELQTRLTALGFMCDIQVHTVNNINYHRVRVGPFADNEVMQESRQKLDELGIEIQLLKERE